MLRNLSKHFIPHGINLNNPDDVRLHWGPLLITMAPPLSGKSTFIDSLQEQVQEFCIDHSEELYQHIDLFKYTDQSVISDNTEQKFLLQFFQEKLTLDQLRAKLFTILSHDEILRDIICTTAADILQQHKKNAAVEASGDTTTTLELIKTKHVLVLNTTTDINHMTTNTLKGMRYSLKHHDGVICWKNQNLSAEFYHEVLAHAHRYQRVVRFIRWGQELPVVSFMELYRRNIWKLLNTGKYVGIKQLAYFTKQAENLFLLSYTGSRKRSHVDLANIAGYNMDDYGRVYPMNIPMPLVFSPTVKQAMAAYPWKNWNNQGTVSVLNAGKKQEASGAKNPIFPPSPEQVVAYYAVNKFPANNHLAAAEDKDFLILDRDSIITESLSSELCSRKSFSSPEKIEEEEHKADHIVTVSVISPTVSNPLPVITAAPSTATPNDADSDILSVSSHLPTDLREGYVSSATASSSSESFPSTSAHSDSSLFSHLSTSTSNPSSSSNTHDSSSTLLANSTTHHDESAAATTMLNNRANRSLTVIYNSAPPNFDGVISADVHIQPEDESKDFKEDSAAVHFMKNDQNRRKGCFRFCCKLF